MFTGLVAEVGTIASIDKAGQNWSMTIRCGFDMADVELGESIAVDGACLTVTRTSAGAFAIDASPETLSKTTLGERRPGDRVHLERALRVGDRLGGHMVLGHVDAVGRLVGARPEGNARLLEFAAPDEVARYLIAKGSVTIDGVSLTVNTVADDRFSVAVIPHTAQKTNLADYAVGRRVNLEADVLGKYVEKFLGRQSDGGITRQMLEDHGF